MKKLITLSAIAILAANIIAQPPQLMSYQSVVRSASGELITKQSIGVRTTILRGSIIQIIVYQETYSPILPQMKTDFLLFRSEVVQHRPGIFLKSTGQTVHIF